MLEAIFLKIGPVIAYPARRKKGPIRCKQSLRQAGRDGMAGTALEGAVKDGRWDSSVPFPLA